LGIVDELDQPKPKSDPMGNHSRGRGKTLGKPHIKEKCMKRSTERDYQTATRLKGIKGDNSSLGTLDLKIPNQRGGILEEENSSEGEDGSCTYKEPRSVPFKSEGRKALSGLRNRASPAMGP